MNVERKYIDETKGYGLFSKCLFPSGETILEEKPLVSVQFSWNAACGYKACDFCLCPLESAQSNAQRLSGNPSLLLPYSEYADVEKEVFPCNLCGLEYCSEDCCMKALTQYHKVLCKQSKNNESHPLSILEEVWKNIHHPPETSSIMLVVKILATILQSRDKDFTIGEFFKFCHRSSNDDSHLAHKLLGEKFNGEISTLNELLVKALPNDGIEMFLKPEGFVSLLALIGTNGQGVGSSAFSKWVKNVTDISLSNADQKKLDEFIDQVYEQMEKQTGLEFLNNEGVALYSLQSTCNHSCMPNAEVSFLHNDNTLSLVALSDIVEGQEICISYLDECMLRRSKKSRQEHLKENYLFVCQCLKCSMQTDDSDTSEFDCLSSMSCSSGDGD